MYHGQHALMSVVLPPYLHRFEKACDAVAIWASVRGTFSTSTLRNSKTDLCCVVHPGYTAKYGD